MSNEGIGTFVKRALVNALGVFLGSAIVPGISYEDSSSLIIAVLLMSLFSSILKPIMVLLALPFVVLTMGLGLLIINALLYMLSASLVDGFSVAGFWAAFFGALIMSFSNLLFSQWIGVRKRQPSRKASSNPSNSRGPNPVNRGVPRRRVKAKDDVIDI